MSNMNNKKIKPFGILIASLAVVLVAIFSTLAVTGAWFTGSDTKTKDSTTPFVLVSLVDGSGSPLAQEVVISTSTRASVKADANIDVYIRAKVVAQFYDGSGNLVSGLDIADYYTITYYSGWTTPSGYEAGFLYYNLSSPIGTASTTNAITTQLITGVARTATPLPSNVTIKLQIFAEGVQGNAAGLAAWAA